MTTKHVLAGCLAVFLHSAAFAQTPATRSWTGNFGAGLALTGGNTDTRNFNFSFALTHDPREKNVVRLNGLYLRGEKDGERTVDRTTVGIRDEYSIWGPVFVFGQTEYVRDKFKEINYLVAPTGGLGIKLLNTDRASMIVDTSFGGIWEKNPGLETKKHGAHNVGERFAWQLSSMSAITQRINALWELGDYGEALYDLGLGLSASVTGNSEIKIEVLDSYKTRPSDPTLKKNDVAVVTAFVLKF